MGTSETSWKVGQLSRLTALTVRTLHHYDTIGLVRPSSRTASGHRLYEERDVRRLYAVIALRELGVPLNAVANLLDTEPDVPGILADHLAQVERQLAALRTVHTRLTSLVRAAEVNQPPTTRQLLEMIEEVSTMEEVFNRYFTPEQLDQLARRREHVGQAAMDDTIAEWPRLIADVQRNMDAGVDPTAPEVRALAARWMKLLESFHGGDPAIQESLYRMHGENTASIQDQGGPGPEMIDYISRANAANAANSHADADADADTTD